MTDSYLALVNEIINGGNIVVFRWRNEKGWPVEFVTENVKDLLGYSNKDFIDGILTYEELIDENDLTKVHEEVERMIINGEDSNHTYAPYRLITADKKEIWVETIASIKRNSHNDCTFFEGTTRDISHRIRNDRRLRTLSAAVEQNPASIVITDLDGNIEYVNPKFTEITGYTFAEALGKNPNILKSGEQNDLFYKKMWEALSCGETWHGSFQNKKKNGDFFIEDAVIGPIKDETGAIIKYLAIKEDITAKNELEERLRQSQRLEAIGHLAGGIAHDFNNILTAINGYVELALLESKDNEELVSDIQQIKLAGERASNLTRQLLTFSRKERYEPQTINVVDRIRNLENMMHHLIMEDIHLETNLREDTPKISADPWQFEQIIVNLVVNAADAIRAHPDPLEKNIVVKTEKRYLDKTLTAANRDMDEGWYLYMEVSDSGTGIPEEIRKHIFEPFFTTKGKNKGTGLGLATVYGIIEQNNAGIEVESHPKHGSIFKIYWKVKEENVELENDAANKVLKAKPGETILFVEDNDQIRRLHTKHLKILGYNVITASNGVEALQKLQFTDEKVDLLFTDVIMPVMDGYELSKQVENIRPGLPVIFASGYLDGQLNEDIRVLGDDHFLHKPYSIHDISLKVRNLLDG